VKNFIGLRSIVYGPSKRPRHRFFPPGVQRIPFKWVHLRLPFAVFASVGAQFIEILPEADRQPGGVGRGNLRLLQCPVDDIARPQPDFERVVFHPAGFWVNLLVFLLVGRDDVPYMVEDDKARIGGALIQR
jgi:hypothetical protein